MPDVPAPPRPPVPAAQRVDEAPPDPRFLQWAPWLVLGLLVASIALDVLGDAMPGATRSMWRAVVLGGLGVLTALWFIACFTGDAESRMGHGFVFAYAFTFGAFALLVTPFVGEEQSRDAAVAAGRPAADAKGPARPREGVLQLVRGCIVVDPQSLDQVSAVTRCPPAMNDTVADAAARAAGGASAADAGAAPRAEVARQFAWLVSVGGVTVRKYRSSLPGGGPPGDTYVEVYGGLAVPFFVVVLAFIGGAVSLSRRIPEYQRRSERGYVPSDKEPAMKPWQAREAVVFQIMQLTSAPFLAVATWYVVSPATTAAAAGLAFGTGFASEPLLLMIRGMVEGIRPEGSRAMVRRTTDLHGQVLAPPGQPPASDVEVTLTQVDDGASRSTRTDGRGEFLFAGLEIGAVVKLTATRDDRRAERELTVADKAAPIELQL